MHAVCVPSKQVPERMALTESSEGSEEQIDNEKNDQEKDVEKRKKKNGEDEVVKQKIQYSTILTFPIYNLSCQAIFVLLWSWYFGLRLRKH